MDKGTGEVKQSTPLTIGITGGIGSGKSTVCGIFSALGRICISADLVAREVTEADQGVRQKIRRAFGDKVFQNNGLLNRKMLADIVFTSKDKLKILDNIVHPAVFEEIDRRIEQLAEKKPEHFIFVEAALIFESGMNARLDYVLLVHADEKVRVRRVMERDNCSEQEVVIRMKSQMPDQVKLKEADFVIMNNDSFDQLRESVKFYDGLFLALRRGRS